MSNGDCCCCFVLLCLLALIKCVEEVGAAAVLPAATSMTVKIFLVVFISRCNVQVLMSDHNNAPSLYSSAACHTCQGSTYDAGQCLNAGSVRCIHASQPFDSSSDAHFQPVSGQVSSLFRIEMSDNLFSENLLSPTKLRSHSMHAQHNGESRRYHWVLGSSTSESLRVLINVSNIQLLPQYNDIEHTLGGHDSSDNTFMHHMGSRAAQGSTTHNDYRFFLNVLRSYCRQPLPDYYTISLEKHGMRTSKMGRRTCGDANDRRGAMGVDVKCPPGYSLGDKYYYRQISKPCAEQIHNYIKYHYLGLFNPYLHGSQQDRVQLGVGNNTFVCAQTTPLLSQIFNMSVQEEFILPMYSETGQHNCQKNAAECQACLLQNQNACPQLNENDTCCDFKCYTQKQCLTYFTEECMTVNPECGRGEVNRYTLTPFFGSLQNQTFSCHLQYIEPEQLYTVTYDLNILKRVENPATGTPRIFKWHSQSVTANVPNKSPAFHRHGEFRVGALLARHWTHIDLPKQYFLKASYSKKDEIMHLSVHQSKTNKEFNGEPIAIAQNEFDQDVYEAKVQVSEPFAVSSVSWLRHYCYVNASLFHRQQSLYRQEGVHISRTFPKKTSGSESFIYNIMNKKLQPRISIELFEKNSILRDYFCRDNQLRENHFNLEKQGLKGSHSSLSSNTVWQINISGEANALPAYLNVQIREVISKSVLFKQDLILLQSQERDARQFFINYSFPLTSRESGQDVDDVAFEVEAVDCQGKQLLSLFSVKVNSSAPSLMTPPTIVMKSESPSDWAVRRNTPYVALLISVAILSLLYLILYLVYMLVKYCRKLQPVVKSRREPSPPTSSSDQSSRLVQMSFNRKMLLIVYLSARIFYNFLFTFSVIISVTLSLQSDLVHRLANLTAAQGGLAHEFHAEMNRLEDFASLEQQRQMQFVQSMRRACDGVFMENIAQIQNQINTMTIANIKAMYNGTNSFFVETQNIMNQRYASYKSQLDTHLDEEKSAMVRSLHIIYTKYDKMLQKVYSNSWLAFPQAIYNKSQFYVSGLYDMSKRPSALHRRHVDFMTFLGISEALELHILPTKIWKQFDELLPDHTQLNVNRDSFNRTNFASPSSLESSVMHNNKAASSNARRFFSTIDDSLIVDQKQQNKESSSNLLRVEQESNAYTSSTRRKLFSFALNSLTFRLALLALDFLLIIFRFYHTYVIVHDMWYGKKLCQHATHRMYHLKRRYHRDHVASSCLIGGSEDAGTRDCSSQQLDLIAESDSAQTQTAALLQNNASSCEHTHEKEVASNCCSSLRNSSFLSIQYVGTVLTISAAVGFLALVLTLDRQMLRTPFLFRAGGFFRRLEALEASRRLWNKLAWEQSLSLNKALLVDTPHNEMLRETQQLMQYVHRFNHEQHFVEHMWRAEICSLFQVDKNICKPEFVRPFLVHFQEQTCFFINVLPQQYFTYFNPFSNEQPNFRLFNDIDLQVWNKAAAAAPDVFPEIEALRIILIQSLTFIFCAVLIAAILHFLGNFLIEELQFAYCPPATLIVSRPPVGFDLLGRRIPAFPASKPQEYDEVLLMRRDAHPLPQSPSGLSQESQV